MYLALRAENVELRAKIDGLDDQVRLLMTSFKNEHKLAIRRMVDDAKKIGLDGYSDDVQRLVKSMKNTINPAAHSPGYYDPDRIRVAVEAHESAGVKAVLQTMFTQTYVSAPAGSDAGDDFSEFDDT